MQYVEFLPVGKRTSRIGLGCANLVGRSSLRESAKLVEAALSLGIRYFDVAPSYGMGTAEEVIGAVIGNSKEITIATKVGIPRPAYSSKANLVRRLIKPALDRSKLLKKLTRRLYERSQALSKEPAQFDFSVGAVRTSLQESLQKLRRDSVDVYLAHEPNPNSLTQEVEQFFRSLCETRQIAAYGVGIGAVGDRWMRFGSIWQSCWPGEVAQHYSKETAYIWHGAIRSALRNESNAKPIRPSAIVQTVLKQSPGSILLVSAPNPTRLKELLQEIG